MRRGGILKLSAALVILIAVAHTSLHFYVWGTGIPGFNTTGIAGLSVGNFAIGEEATGKYTLKVSISQIFVIAEWILVLFLIVFGYVRGKVFFKKEVMDLSARKSRRKGANKTDIDKLYEILQEKKHLGFMAVQKVFEVDEKVVNDWAKTLEAGKLAVIDYPRFGEPELVLTEKN